MKLVYRQVNGSMWRPNVWKIRMQLKQAPWSESWVNMATKVQMNRVDVYITLKQHYMKLGIKV